MSFGNKPPNQTNMNLGLRRSDWFSSPWVGISTVAAIIVLGLALVFQDRWMGTPSTAEHAATTTDALAPGTAPLTPLPSVTPATTPKP
jgi:hypothetical protein